MVCNCSGIFLQKLWKVTVKEFIYKNSFRLFVSSILKIIPLEVFHNYIVFIVLR